MMLMQKLLLFFSLFMVGCAHFATGPKASPILDNSLVKIEFKPNLTRPDITDYHTKTVTKAFTNNQVTAKLIDVLDFSVETKTLDVDAANNSASYRIKTIKKEGKADLTDFALPELDETLDLTMTNSGKVLRAGDYPPGTLFFVPPTSLPDREVKVGDTWPMNSEWVSLKSGLPLKMQTVSTLRAIRSCGTIGRCAEVDVVGLVELVGGAANAASPHNDADAVLKMRFQSQLHGTMLFSLDRGTVLYSYLKSTERLTGEKDRVDITSCMLTHITEPKEENIVGDKPAVCEPDDELPKFD